MATTIISASDLRERMEEILKSAAEHPDPQYVTYRGRPIAVLMGYEHYEALMERLEDLSDVVAIYERRGEPRISLEEYLATRDRGGGALHVQSVSTPVR